MRQTECHRTRKETGLSVTVLAVGVLIVACTLNTRDDSASAAPTPASTAVMATETPTLLPVSPLPPRLEWVVPQPGSSLSAQTFALGERLGTATGNICAVIRGTEIAMPQHVFTGLPPGELTVSVDGERLELSGEELSVPACYEEARNPQGTLIAQGCGASGPAYFCWSADLSAGVHRATLVYVRSSGQRWIEYEWFFELTEN